VEFRLLYWGEVLASSNTKRRSAEKQAMRREFHPQLKRLWKTRRNLRFFLHDIGMRGAMRGDAGQTKHPPNEQKVTAHGGYFVCHASPWHK
jgi:hypothetical protein